MITQANKEILQKYADYKKEANRLEKITDELKIEVLEIMQNNDLGEIAVGNDKISLSSRRTWIYSKDLQEKEKGLKEEKKTEERIGTATYKENFYPVFSDSDNKKKSYGGEE